MNLTKFAREATDRYPMASAAFLAGVITRLDKAEAVSAGREEMRKHGFAVRITFEVGVAFATVPYLLENYSFRP